MQNLPDAVYKLLEVKCGQEHCELVWMIGGHGEQVELTLRWLPRGSKWEDPFVTPVNIPNCDIKHKSPGCRKRDINRRKWFNVKKNSIATVTEDCTNNLVKDESPISQCTLEHSGESDSHDPKCMSAISEAEHSTSDLSEVSHDQSMISQADPDTDQNNSTSECDLEIVDKENYVFRLFKKAFNDTKNSVITAQSIDDRFYQYHYDKDRTEPICELLRKYCLEVCEAKLYLPLRDNILECRSSPWHDYLICLHEFAKNDFEMG